MVKILITTIQVNFVPINSVFEGCTLFLRLGCFELNSCKCCFLALYCYILFSQKAGPIRDVISSGIDNKCHWWSGYDLLRRLLFFIVYLMFENFSSGYTQVSDTLVVN